MFEFWFWHVLSFEQITLKKQHFYIVKNALKLPKSQNKAITSQPMANDKINIAILGIHEESTTKPAQ